MPVFFYLDPEIEKDPHTKDVTQLTLSYTFFPIQDDEEEETAAVNTTST
jgi:cytochrome c oxidase assembly protein subunit 11